MDRSVTVFSDSAALSLALPTTTLMVSRAEAQAPPQAPSTTPTTGARDAVAINLYDGKLGIQAIATTAPGARYPATFAREHEYKRHCTVSLLAGIDVSTSSP